MSGDSRLVLPLLALAVLLQSTYAQSPTVQVAQSSYSVNTGSQITLGCTVTSSSTVTSVFWQKSVNGFVTTITSTTNTNKYSGSTTANPSLTIINADSTDIGVYTCFASNAFGTGSSATTTLSVGSNTLPAVTIAQSGYSIGLGNSVTLQCTVSSTTTVTDVFWQKSDGNAVTTIRSTTNTNKYSGSTPNTPSLTIFNTATTDAGQYTCFATNAAGTGQSQVTTLSVVTNNAPTTTVGQSAYSVSTGSSITLVCTVTSSLTITNVFWQSLINGVTSTITSGTNINKYSGSTTTTPSLTIFNAASSDAGSYTCFASNSAGTSSGSTTTLSVTSQNLPVVQIQKNAYNVVNGDTVTIVCTVTSSTTITSVYWQRNSLGAISTITPTTNINKYSGSTPSIPSLTITGSSLIDAGDYTCFATSSAGTGQSSPSTLTVLAQSVPSVAIQQQSYSVTTGGSVTLTCTVTSNIAITNVRWERNVGGVITSINSGTNTNKYSGSTTTTPSLTIFSAAQSDSGQYTCFGSNSAGEGQSAPTTLSVTGTVPTVTVTQPLYTVNSGNSVTLVCSVFSDLTLISVQWQRNVGGTVTTISSNTDPGKYSGSSTSVPSLTIFNAASTDAGTYTCFASNSVGTGLSSSTLLSVVIQNPPTVQIQQPSYSVTTGSSVTLVCTVSSSLPITNVYWQRNIGGTITTITSTTNTNKYSGSTTTTPSLTIFSSDQNDAGTYTCFASNSVGTGQSTTTTLSVTGNPPTVQIQQPSYSVTTGSSVTLVCTVSSSLPVTNVYWQRNVGGTITTITSTTNTNKYSGSTTTTPSLTIFSSDQNDAGTYTCFASNSVGTGQSTTTTLSVTGNPPTVQIQQPSYSVTTGSSVTLVCTVSSSLPITNVYWQRNVGGTITTITSTTNTNKYSGSTPTTPSLTIFNDDQSDAGQYTCFASNSVGTGQSTTTTLTVTGNPPTVQIQQPSYSVTTGSSVTLVCTVTSSLPVTNVYWQRNVGGTITTITSTTNTNKYSGSTSSTPSLTIFSSDQNDAGQYTCFASNSAGTGQSTTTTLSVTGNPPTVQIQQPSYSVTTGSTVTLVCTVSSSLPITNVYWQRNVGGTITTITSTTNINKYSGSTPTIPSLTIFSDDQSDAGQYICFASNSVGTGQSSPTTLSVTGNPPTVQIQQSSYSVTTGNSVTLVCTVTSSLPLTNVYWQRNVGGTTTTITSTTNANKYSGSTTTTPSLTIFGSDQNDSGQYTCFASNSVGTGQSSPTTLSVTGNPPTVQIQQPSYSVTTGNSVTLSCTVTSALAVTNVYWQRNVGGTTTTITSTTNANKYSGSTTTTPSLTIFSADQNDAGTYTCFASNSVGTGQSTTTTLSVTGNPPTVQIQQPSYSVTTGNSVTLVCTVTSALPVTNVYWQRNIGGTTTTITSTTNTNKYTGSTTTTPSLTVFSADQNDAGTYTCFASNSVGTGQSTTTTLSVTGSPPTVQIQQTSYFVTTGNSVTLVCTVTSNLPVTNVYWQRNIGGTITTISSTTNTNKYSGSTTTTPSLTIFGAAQSDGGQYTCFASNSVGTGQSSATTLSVTENPPTVQIQQTSYSVTTFNSVTLVCTVTSNLPITSVFWQRNIGGTITTITSTTNTNKYSGSTTTTPSLTIFSATQSDAGSYTCFASNSVGTGQSSATTLSVTETPPVVQIQQTSYSVTIGNAVTLVCFVTSNIPITNVQWQRNIGGTITTITSTTDTNKYSGSTTTTPSLTIFSAAQSDAGQYTCFASNSVGTGQSSVTTLSVSGTPPTVQIQQSSYSVVIGSSVTLVCTVTSNLPVTSVQWQKNVGGTTTTITSTTDAQKYSGSSTSTPSLTILNAVQSDAGTYTCFATNSVGTGQSSTTTLTVLGTPPTVVIQQPTYSVTFGDSVTLVCNVTSNLPVTLVQWQHYVGGTITTITSSTNANKYSGSTPITPSLKISNADFSDAGPYTCFASNSVGTGQSSSTTLSILGTPPTVVIQQPNYSVTIGNSITLVCTVTSNLPVTSVQWQQNVGGTITTITPSTNVNKYSGSSPSTPSLTISNAVLSDAGTYTCFATNSAGTGQSSSTTLSVSGTPPTVVIQQPTYSVTIGNSITLVCTVTSNLPVTSVQWQQNVGGTITTITPSTNVNKYSGSSPSTPSLTISNAVLSDAGTYTCFATNSAGTGQSSTTTLSVSGTPPTVVIQQPTYSVTIGNSITLVCTVTSNLPMTSVQWQQNVGGTITTITPSTNVNKYSGSSPSTPSLTISNAVLSDAGTYTCFATNSAGTGQSSATTLNVLGTPPTVVIQQPTYSVTIGNSITLVCTVTSNLPVTSVQWQQNVGGTITTITPSTNVNKYSGSSPSTPSLTISNAVLSDAGTYTCFATNSAGTGQSSSTTLSVSGTPPTVVIQQPTYSVTIGNSVTLTCTVTSNLPVTSVQWQQNVGGTITNITPSTNVNKYSGSSPSTPSLTISNAVLSDAGTYTCFATNSAGTGQSSTTTLSVSGTPPTVVIQQPTYSVTIGNSITLVCTVTSNLPVTSVQWQQNVGGTITTITPSTNVNKYSGSSPSTPSLTISNAVLSDAGTYTCFATNSAGTGQSSTTTLSVSGTPPTVVIQQPTYSVTIGNSITLTCTVTSNLPVTSVQWQQNVGGTITNITPSTNVNKYSGSSPSTPSLTISNAVLSDAGTYTCFATNSAGTGQSSTTTLSVSGTPPTVVIQQPTYSVTIGNSITLVCTVTSNLPVTSVQWQQNVGGTITTITPSTNVNKYSGSSPSTPSLMISNAVLSDAGTYTCFATNSAGTGQSSSTTLSVSGTPPTVVIQQPTYSVTIGNSITLVCTVTSNLPVTSVQWQQNVGGTITTITPSTNVNKYSGSSPSTPSLTISNAVLSDAGTYTCFATNSAGTGQSSTTTLSVSGTPPTVIIQQPTYFVTIGDTVTLVCTVTSNLPVTSVQWQQNVGGTITNITPSTNANRYSGSSPTTPSLMILNVALSDSGNYTCFATNSVGTGQSSATTLSVTGTPPTVQIQQPTYSATIGNTVTLVCTVTSNLPLTNVQWQRNVGGTITTITSTTNTNKYGGSTTTTPSLTIFSAAQSDSGQYTCFASNSVGQGQSTATTLTVTGTVPTVQIQQPTYSVTIGDSVILVCTVTSNLPVISVQWQQNVGGSITNITSTLNTNKYSGSTPTNPSLTISNAVQGDAGVYTCFATNSVGTGQSITTTLSVTGMPPNVEVKQPLYSTTVGKSITLNCTVTSALPVTSVQWQISADGTTIFLETTNTIKYSGASPSTPSLTIFNLTLSDAGNYTCFATNIIGTGKSTATRLNVTGTPPTVQVQQPSYSVITGNSVTLVCTVTSNLPVTDVYWQRNIGGTITTITSSTNTNKYSGSTPATPSLTIVSTAQSDVGTYTCFAINSVGTGQSTTTTLTVTGTPPVVTVQQSSYSVIYGDAVTLICFVNSNLQVTSVYWQRNVGGIVTTITSSTNNNKYGGSGPSVPSLTIFNAASTDAGTYTCFATNIVGTGQSSSTELSVIGSIPVVQILQPSYSVLIGSSVTLECTVTANPFQTSVVWQKIENGVPTNINTGLLNKYSGSTVNTPSLTILNVVQSDSGNYICTATNVVGTGTSQQTALSVTGSIPVVTVSQPTYSVSLGGTVTLGCTVTASPQHTSVQWQRIQNGVTTAINMGSSKYSGSLVNSPALSINNADLNDNGAYICTATNVVGTGTSSQTVLTVVGNPPTVVVQQPSYSVLVGNTVTLVCTVTSNPAATSVSWQLTKNGVTTTINVPNNSNKYSGSTVNVPSLTIFNSAESDSGNYVCSAVNQFGTGSSTTTTLTVTGSIPTVTVLKPTYSVNYGAAVTLECVVSSNPAHTSVLWQRLINNQFQPVTFSSSSNKYSGSSVATPSLTLNVTDLNDEGYYKCTATNMLGTGESSQTFLDVIGNVLTVTIQQPQYSVLIGGTVTLGCTVTGSPSATNVFWQKTVNNVVTTITSNTNTNKYSGSTVNIPSLTIAATDLNDRAIYVCFATNAVGTAQSTQTFLDVTGNIPSVQVLQSQYSVNFGSSITLQCTVTANPAHTSVQWLRVINGQTSSVNMNTLNKYSGSTVNTPSLTINSAAVSDLGTYICTATNSIGTGQSAQTFLDVVGNVLTVQIVQTTYSVLIGQSRTLECLVSGSPAATAVYWQKIQNSVTTTINSNTNTNKYTGSTVATPSLTVLNADLTDRANYICFATNAVGTGQSQQTFLDVTGNIPSVVIQQPQYAVLLGTSVTLVCTVSANPTHTTVFWRKLVNSVPTDITITNNNKYSGSTVNTPSLTINNADNSDEGNYICYASNSIGTGQSAQTFLDVYGAPPVVTVANPSYSVNIGNTVTLDCSVSANPAATSVYWQKIKSGITTTINSGTNTNKYAGATLQNPSLQIFNTDQSDVATYVCFAANSIGTGQSQQTVLNVIGNIPVVQILKSQYSVNYGASVTLECTVTASPLHTSVQWKRTVNGVDTTISTTTVNNKYTGSTVSVPSLTINAADSNDKGFYTCYATNSVGTGNSAQTYLDVVGTIPTVNVLSNQYTVTLGNSITLECVVQATPTHTSVQWQRVINGQTTNIQLGTNTRYTGSTVNVPSLTISATDATDKGYYTCTATNIAGTGRSQQTYLDVVGSIPVVVVSLPNYNSNIGGTVTLGCVVTASPTHNTVYWQRIDSNGVGTTVDMTITRYSGSTVNTPSLTISNVALSDKGSYRCYAANTIGTGQSQNTYLDVIGNIPVVTITSPQYSVNIGSSVTLECTVVASPTHTAVYWTRNVNGVSTQLQMNTGKFSGSTVSNPSLTISNAANSDEGYYICFATNSVGTGQSGNTFLDVIGSIPLVNIPQPSYSVNYGGTVTLTCTVTANPTHTNVYWQKIVNSVPTTITIGGRYTGSTVGTPSLTISNAVQSDAAFYICYATNSVGTGNSQQTYLGVEGSLPVVRVLSNIYSVNIGNTVTLECTVTANPAHTSVQWVRIINGVQSTVNLGGNVQKYSGSTVNAPSLIISNAEQADKGYYICQATNAVGTGQSSQTYLDVIGSILSVVVAQLQYNVNYGNSITLVCTVSGTPAATAVYWQKLRNGQTTTINSNTNTNKYTGSVVQNPSLTISNADDSDGATYTCFATNSVGTGQSQQTTLSIVGNLPIATIPANTYSVIVGGSITIPCTVSGNPAVTSVQWSRNINGQTETITVGSNTRFSGGSVNSPSLVIANTQTSDKGYYTCSATNIVGTGSSQAAFLDITGSIPIVSIPLPQYSVTVGQSVTLTCTVTSNPQHTSVKWVKALNNVNTNIDLTNTNKYSGSTVGTPSLTINSAQSSDGGYYTCFATNTIGTGQSSSTFLNVVGNAPQVNILSPTYSVNVGSSVTLQCTVSANPLQTNVYWKKITGGVATNIDMTTNNKYGGSTVSSPSLIISNADINDEGFYVCFADNSVGTGQSSQTFLDVIGNAPVVNVLQMSYSGNIGSSITLECTVTSNPPHTVVYWQRTVAGTTTRIDTTNSKYSGSTVSNPSLKIDQLALTDSGSYRCLADNSIGTGQSQLTVLNVVGNVPTVVLDRSIYNVTFGGSITIGCTITSNPAFTNVYWQRISNGVTQTVTVTNNNKYSGASMTTPSLTIFNADGNDKGEYICFATNTVGTGQSARGTLDVTGSVPTVRVLKPNYNVQRGNPITLECEVISMPQHTSVYWTKIISSQPVTLSVTGAKYGGSSVSSPSLIIYNVQDSDEGSYVCYASNGIGTGQSSQTYLNVEGFVPSVTASVVPSVTVGNSVVINCAVIADPKETAIVWQKVINGVPTSLAITSSTRYSGGTVSTPSLTIAKVQDSDEGQYLCLATNSVGTGTSNVVYLDVVGEAPHLTYVTPARIVVTEGALIYSTCVSTANPAATFTWYKDSSNQVYATGEKLEIKQSSRTDMGMYTCRASNNYGTDSVSLTVDVQYKPDVTISTTTTTFSGVGGGSVNIPCTYVANPAVTAVTWRKITTKETTALTINGNKYGGGGLYQSGLTIYQLDASDVASYQCVATNLVGTGESRMVQLNVDTQAAPFNMKITPVYIDVVIGTSFDATCTASGDPSPTFAWYFKDKMILTGPKLSITKSTVNDDGMYTCVATNSLGMQQATLDANIRYAPVSTVTITEFSRVIGNPVTLTCSTRANPSATEWTWAKDGTTLQNHNSETFLVNMDSLQDLGTYSCIAKNTVGQSSKIEFTVKQGTSAALYEVVSVSQLSAGEIAAIVVGVCLAIAITAMIIICCFSNRCCRKEKTIQEVPQKQILREPVYLKDVNLQLAPQYKAVEYIQQEPQYLRYETPRYYSQNQYLPAIEYLTDYDEERRRKRKKTRKPEQVVLEERIVGGGDIYQTNGSVYRTVDRNSQLGGDVYIETVTQ